MKEEEKVFNIGFITNFGSLDLSLIDHYKTIGDSILSWMIMLEDDKFEDLRKEVKDLVTDSGNTRYILPLILHCKGKPKEGYPLTSKDIIDAIDRIRNSFILISLVKRGLIAYISDKNDGDWDFTSKCDKSVMQLAFEEYKTIRSINSLKT